MLLRIEFRDGNVPAGFEQVRELENALSDLPSDIEKVCYRLDSDGYQHVLLHYCATGKNKRFGVIEFAI